MSDMHKLRKKIADLIDFHNKDLEDNWLTVDSTCEDHRSEVEEVSIRVEPPNAKTLEEVQGFRATCSVHCTKYLTFVRKKKNKERTCRNCKCEPVCKVILQSQQSLQHYHAHGGSLDFYDKLEVLLADYCEQYIPA